MLVLAPLALAIEQGSEEFGSITQLLGLPADFVPRFIFRRCQIATVLLYLVTKTIEGRTGKRS